MKVKALQAFYGFGGTWKTGDVGLVADPIAKSYIEAGLVETVSDVKPASIVTPTPVEEAPAEEAEDAPVDAKAKKVRMKRSKPETVETPEVA